MVGIDQGQLKLCVVGCALGIGRFVLSGPI